MGIPDRMSEFIHAVREMRKAEDHYARQPTTSARVLWKYARAVVDGMLRRLPGGDRVSQETDPPAGGPDPCASDPCIVDSPIPFGKPETQENQETTDARG